MSARRKTPHGKCFGEKNGVGFGGHDKNMINIVRPHTKKELEGIAKLNYLVDIDTMSHFWTESYTRYYIEHGLQDAEKAAFSFSDHILAAEDDETVVGMVVFCEAYANFDGERLVPNSGMINNVYVLPEYRSKGIGSKLLDRALNCLKQYEAITLYVYEENMAAIEFYLHYGFRFDGVSYIDGAAYKGQFLRMVIYP